MGRFLLLQTAFCFSTFFALAQVTGEVDYPTLGIRFTIPEGWKGAESGEMFLMGSDTQPGLILLMTHQETKIQTLKDQAAAGLVDEGVNLQKSGEFEEIGAEGIGAEFSGTIQGTPAKAYVSGVINPFGTGVTILAATDIPNYSPLYRELAREIAMGLKFSEPIEPPVTQEWRDALQGAKLTYLDSYSSSGGSSGGYSSYGGYSNHEEILLCGDRFSFYKSSSMSIDTGGAFASGGGKGSDSGTWSVAASGNGTPLLRLTYDSGKVSEYELSYENKKTYLNGYRYFRTFDHGECR